MEQSGIPMPPGYTLEPGALNLIPTEQAMGSFENGPTLTVESLLTARDLIMGDRPTNSAADIFDELDQTVADIEAMAAPRTETQISMELDSYLTFMAGQLQLDSDKLVPLMSELRAAFDAKGRNGVNEILFARLEALKQAPKAAAQLDSDALIALSEIESKWKQESMITQIRREQGNIDTSVRNYVDYQRRMHECLKLASESRLQLEILQGKVTATDKYKTAMQDLTGRGFELHRIDVNTGVIEVITPEITLSHFNSEAGVTYACKMGRYKIRMTLRDMYCDVQRFEGNILVDRYYFHPHVGSGNEVCYGNAASMYSIGAKEGDIAKCISTTYAVLCEYNDESPYRSLAKFWQVSNPDYLKSLAQVWVKSSFKWWVDLNEFSVQPRASDLGDSDYRVMEDSDDEVEMTKFSPWILAYQGTDIEVKDADGRTQYAICAGNNQKVAFNWRELSVWEEV